LVAESKLVPFDVVIVPDFSGRASATFEARTLYFLASWLEFTSDSRSFPLHVACIGEPPRTVRELAKRCGARISLHEPMPPNLGVFANKLRGFEAPLETDRLLLLDADIFILADLAPLARIVPERAIAATHSHSAIILPEMWEELYARLRLPLPAKTMMDFHLTLEDGVAAPDAGLYTSYSSGAILAPKQCGLYELWLEHLQVLGEYRARWMERLAPLNMLVGDEPALATAIRALERRGQRIVIMPERFHGKWRHLYRRSPKLGELAIFHMSSSFARGATLAEKLDPDKFFYERKLLRRYAKRWLLHSRSAREALRMAIPASMELRLLHSLMTRLYERHIRGVVS
jgi:hypothetical protein